jgi:hypothetical protein
LALPLTASTIDFAASPDFSPLVTASPHDHVSVGDSTYRPVETPV